MMLTAKQVADMLGLSRSKVYDLARRGALPSYRFDGALRFEAADVEAFKVAHRVAPATEPAVGSPLRTITLKVSGPTGENALSKYFRSQGLVPGGRGRRARRGA